MEKYESGGKQKDMLVFALFAVLSVLFLIPFLSDITNLGISDWDLHFSYVGIPAETIMKYHQFPLWNPYSCGGEPLLAHPESSFLSPFFIFILILGEVIGLKILVLIHLFLGMAGMYLLTRRIGIGREGAFFSSVIFMLSTHYSIHIVAGHTTDYMPMAFMPFAFLFYLMAIDKKTDEGYGNKALKKRFLYATASSLSILLMFLSGAVYSLAFFAIFLISYSFFESILRKKIRPIIFCIVILIMAALLGSVKLVPMLGFLMHNNTHYDADWESNSPKTLFLSLFSREQGYYSDKGTNSGWWEYSTYIGIIPFALFLLGSVLMFRRRASLILSIAPFILFYFGNSLPINFWSILHSLPLISFFRVPSRSLLMVLFCLAIISGDGIDAIKTYASSRRKTNLKNILVYSAIMVVIAIIIIDLFLVNWPNLSLAFPFKNQDLGSSGVFESTKSTFTGIAGYNNLSYSYVYMAFLSNKGALNGVDCKEERVFVPTMGSALPKESSTYMGEAYLGYGKGIVSRISFSPNRIIADVNAADSDRLVLNQNYYFGWRARIDGKKAIAESYNNLVSVPVGPGSHEIEIYYLPDTFIMGVLAEIAAIMAWLVAFLYLSRIEGKK